MDPKIRNLQNSYPLSFRYQKPPSLSLSRTLWIMAVEFCYIFVLFVCLLLVSLSIHYFWMLAFCVESCSKISGFLFLITVTSNPARPHSWNWFDEQGYNLSMWMEYCLGAYIWAVPWSFPLLPCLILLAPAMLFHHTFPCFILTPSGTFYSSCGMLHFSIRANA